MRVGHLWRRVIAALVAVGVLAVPGTAQAWSWGYNYMGQTVNQHVVAGWNYWSYATVDKANGDWIWLHWTTQSGGVCPLAFYGAVSYTSTPGGDCGYGGYLYLDFGWSTGYQSYVHLTAN
jgi:hypothetical protein